MIDRRSRIHRCFIEWLETARPRLAIQPRLTARKNGVLAFSFDGITEAINAGLSIGSLNICVYWNDDFWDYLYSEDISVGRRHGLYECLLCQPEQRTPYATREALWVEHVFEFFAEWINERLDPATHLAIYGIGGIRDARLVSDTTPFSRSHLIALVNLRPDG